VTEELDILKKAAAYFAKMSGYGTAPTADQTMYENVLQRAPDTSGFQFCESAMHNGLTTAQLLVSFSDSTENQTNIAKIIGQGFSYTPGHS
jgi:hypothetical protein